MTRYIDDPQETVTLDTISRGDVIFPRPTAPARVLHAQHLPSGRVRLWVRSVHQQGFVTPRPLRSAAGDTTITRVVP